MNRLEEMEQELTKLKDSIDMTFDRQDFIEELTSIVLLETDKSVKVILNDFFTKFKEEADKNGDGKVSVNEAIDYGLETLNGSGVTLILGILVTTILSAGFMLLRGIIDVDVFLLVLQITIPNSLITYISKRVICKLGGKAGNMSRYIKVLEEDNRQKDMIIQLKQAHEREYIYDAKVPNMPE